MATTSRCTQTAVSDLVRAQLTTGGAEKHDAKGTPVLVQLVCRVDTRHKCIAARGLGPCTRVSREVLSMRTYVLAVMP